MKARETREVVNIIRDTASDDATVIYGFVYDESLGDQLRVTVVATGLGGAAYADYADATKAASGDRVSAPAQAVAPVAPAAPAYVAPAADPVGYRGYAHNAVVAEAAMRDPQRGLVQTFDNYEELSEPTFMRRQREQVTPRVVNGEDFSDLDVPAFLRRQAD